MNLRRRACPLIFGQPRDKIGSCRRSFSPDAPWHLAPFVIRADVPAVVLCYRSGLRIPELPMAAASATGFCHDQIADAHAGIQKTRPGS